MNNILLINIDPELFQNLVQAGYELEEKKTVWDWGGTSPIIPSKETNVIFYNAHSEDTATSAHSDNRKFFEDFVKEGGVVVTFVGNCQTFHIKNLIGGHENFMILNTDGDQKAVTATTSKFEPIFSKFGRDIGIAKQLMEPTVKGDFTLDPNIDNFEALAFCNTTRKPVALKYTYGKGFYVFLPHFGARNSEVAFTLLQETFPEIAPDLFYKKDIDWILADSQYYFPRATKIHTAIDKIQKHYDAEHSKHKTAFDKAWQEEQQDFNKLLTTGNDELKECVARVFKYLQWHVVDCDKYWEKIDPSRDKAEDLWLMDKKFSKLERIKNEALIVTEVKGIKGASSDDDCGAITKYINRRTREFKNTNLKGLFVINHFNRIPAALRKPAFTSKQIDDAQANQEAFLTTYELFKALKAEKEGKLTKEDIKKIITETSGEVIFTVD